MLQDMENVRAECHFTFDISSVNIGVLAPRHYFILPILKSSYTCHTQVCPSFLQHYTVFFALAFIYKSTVFDQHPTFLTTLIIPA